MACPPPAHPRAHERAAGEVAAHRRDGTDPEIDRDPALPGPVHVTQVEQQRELVHDQGEPAAVADGHHRVPAGPLLAPDGDRPDTGQQPDPPHVVMQVLAADTQVAEWPASRANAVGYAADRG